MKANYDSKTVAGFSDQWQEFDRSRLSKEELERQFEQYFRVFLWENLPQNAIGFDIGCGTGRWAKLVAPQVDRLHCIDASEAVLRVARKNLREFDNCEFHRTSFETIPLDDNSQDFGYSLGVLHHIPDTAAGIKACVDKLEPGVPFLLYVYYAFDNRPYWFKAVWAVSDRLRRLIFVMPFRSKFWITQAIALLVYYSLSRLSRLLELSGMDVRGIPLAQYRRASFYTMRTVMPWIGLGRGRRSDLLPCKSGK